MERRDFLQKSALSTAGLLASGSLFSQSFFAGKIKDFGFQVYTVRDVIKKDMAGTLKTLRKAGYGYAEFFDFADGKLLGKPIKEAKAIIDASKIKLKSIHVGTGAQTPNLSGTMVNDWQRAVDDAAELGAEYLVCAYLGGGERQTLDQYKQVSELFNKSAELCQKSGLKFAYHNHDFEFKAIDGQVPYDILLNETEADLVKMELDMYWVRYADKDPIEMIQKDKGRFPLWHVKDMSMDDNKAMKEVGAGRIDWKQLFDYNKDAGLEYFFVEQDGNWAVSSVESLLTSIKHLKKI
ncbi:sugar phosphate isomerase/epimerase family protein [Roseivirga echinicomitans]